MAQNSISPLLLICVWLPSNMAHFLSCHKKSLLTKQWLSSLIIILDFMVYHKSLCFIDTLPCWKIWQSFTRKLNTKLIMSAARHPRIDGLIERVDETMQISLRCYSSGLVFWLGISYTHCWFLLHVFNQWDFDTFKVPYDLLADYLINYGQWLMHRLSLPATCLSWQVFRMLYESWHSPSNVWLLVLLD
jgi:hypothetical protein